jgi:hypothetical protein
LRIFITNSPTATARKHAHRRLRFEQLETRTVLSANFGPASFDLSIRGTDVQFSPLGLPAAMVGEVRLAAKAAPSHAPIGRYHETLTPILMDINGDQVPDFVGTQGVATFTFFVGAPQFMVGSITTANTSYIQGVTETAQLLVGSQGTIVASTGVLRNLSGGFGSQSTVGLMPSFEMQTNVHFTVNRPVAPVFSLLAIANDMLSGSTVADTSDCKSNASTESRRGHGKGHDRDDAGAHDGGHHRRGVRNDSKHEAPPSRHHAHDQIFAEDMDWRLSKADKKLR